MHKQGFQGSLSVPVCTEHERGFQCCEKQKHKREKGGKGPKGIVRLASGMALQSCIPRSVLQATAMADVCYDITCFKV